MIIITPTSSNFISLEQLEQCAEAHAPWVGCPFREQWGLESATFATSDVEICDIHGHDIVDMSYGGPDSGNMDHGCKRCGEYWSVPLY